MAAKPNDKYIPLYFVAFFAVIFAVNGVFVYVATQTHSGVVTENAYEKGLDYNSTIQLAQQQKELGLDSKILVEGDDIIFKLNQPINAEVIAYIVRPAKQGFDYEIKLDGRDGEYISKANFPLKGQWEVRIVAEWDGQKYQQIKRVMVK